MTVARSGSTWLECAAKKDENGGAAVTVAQPPGALRYPLHTVVSRIGGHVKEKASRMHRFLYRQEAEFYPQSQRANTACGCNS